MKINDENLEASGFKPLSDSEYYILLCEIKIWLITIHKICIEPEPTGSWRFVVKYRYEDLSGKHYVGYSRENGKITFHDTYLKALESGILKAFNLLKERKIVTD